MASDPTDRDPPDEDAPDEAPEDDPDTGSTSPPPSKETTGLPPEGTDPMAGGEAPSG